jgi:two-component system sensor histidine kinase DesK
MSSTPAAAAESAGRRPIIGGVNEDPPLHGLVGLVRLRRLTWSTMVACLAAVAGLVVAQPDVPRAITAPAVLLVCLVSGRLFAVEVLYKYRPRYGAMVTMVVVAAAAAGGILALARAAGTGGFAWVLPLAALAAAVWAGTPWPRWFVGPAAAALALGASAAGSWSAGAAPWQPAAIDTAIAALCAAGLYAQVWVQAVAERLDAARKMEREMAVYDERLRIAADLHDIQGHNLHVIALKSELAQRLSEAEPARAAAEMRDVQELARQALGDSRELVWGHRAVSLDTEMSNAARVLAAAGIEASLSRPPDVPPLPAPVAKLLGLVVRECTTNVLRHSAAKRCDVALTVDDGTAHLRFTNDLPLGGPAGPAGGLAGLADRLAAAGGRLEAQGTPDAFAVSAYLPTPTIQPDDNATARPAGR